MTATISAGLMSGSVTFQNTLGAGIPSSFAAS